MNSRLDNMSNRLARIEGGLALGSFAILAYAALRTAGVIHG